MRIRSIFLIFLAAIAFFLVMLALLSCSNEVLNTSPDTEGKQIEYSQKFS